MTEVGFIVFPGCQMLDAIGPLTVFEIAERFRPGSYRVCLMAPDGGTVTGSSGVEFLTLALDDRVLDTVVVAGGEGLKALPSVGTLVEWLRRSRARRIASVCSGAFLLAEAGLLDGRRATTHWANVPDFTRRYPRITVDGERIFIRDGDVWTSAGISAGIDLALALIEDDHGAELARRVAQQLVVHQRRPGGQSQFSALVELGGQTGRFAELIGWMRGRLKHPLTVEELADRVAMSPRHFARTFAIETGTTPAKAVERLRLEVARAVVETSHEPLERIAEDTGFNDTSRMRRSFVRVFGCSPQAMRRVALG